MTSGPPRFGVPVFSQSGQGARSRVVPSGTSQRSSPLARSIAASVPQGGGLHGAPSGESSGARSSAYGVPSCGSSAVGRRRVAVLRAHLLARQQADARRDALRVDDQQAALGIDRHAAPVHAADHARVLERALARRAA